MREPCSRFLPLLSTVVLLLGAATPPALAGPVWLPPGTLYPRALADPREPRTGLTYAPDPEFLDASLGGPIPLIGFTLADHPSRLVLEVDVFLRLGRQGSFFPLETVDGLFGLSWEAARGSFQGRLRVIHESAHLADGDSTVVFPADTFSREYWNLELGKTWSRFVLYGQVGASWHSVPDDDGLDLALGGTWRILPGTGRPFLFFHLEAESAQEWRLNQSIVAGWETGATRQFRIGLRYYNGNSPRGQYWRTTERYLGLEMQFSI